jgi:hypothetical protein
MRKKQRVRFHKNDKRPGETKYRLNYRKKMVKIGGKIVWQVIEHPTKSIVAEYFFEEDADKLVKFQNKHLVWQESGGIPSFLCKEFKRR